MDKMEMSQAGGNTNEPAEALYHTAIRFADSELPLTLAKVGFDLGVFKLLTERDTSVSVDEIARRKDGDPALISRILRYLSSHGFIKQTDKDHFAPNNVTRNLADDRVQGSVEFTFTVGHLMSQALPAYLRENNYRMNPDGRLPWNDAFQTDMSFFDWLQNQPETLNLFQKAMSVPPSRTWLDVVALGEMARGVLEADPDRVVFVDVGGGAGHECVRLAERFPEFRGHIILQDLEETVNKAPSEEGVTRMAHNFFTPQVVKGARFYYLRRILHDWSTEKAIEILHNLVPALAPDSRILIDEVVLPNVDVPHLAAAQDMRMLTIAGSGERNMDDWTSLLDACGLDITDIKGYCSILGNSVIIAEKRGTLKN